MGESARLVKLAASLTAAQITVLIMGSLSLLFLFGHGKSTFHGAPVAGRRSRWEPTFWLQSRFIFGARQIISSGYRKVRIRESAPTTLLRSCGNQPVVLPSVQRPPFHC